jgi:rare lipoprotein A
MRTLLFFVMMLLITSPAYAGYNIKKDIVASWYGEEFHGRITASGEVFNQNDFTAAHRSFPFGTELIVTYNDKSVRVRINDRGPYKKGRKLDLSKAAADALGCGLCVVTIMRIGCGECNLKGKTNARKGRKVVQYSIASR